ncbi:MAG: OsmC family protein [Candidatus Omnitrophica bacterium]|nr:hypothetical protein [bacterium]NUN97829.1 OsmC family protein [Candidatus Omnitrophota bacterium]
MVDIHSIYHGDLRTEARHGPSGTTLITDAPVDNCGKGESFSPTDLVATALGTCMLTTMGIVAQRHNLTLDGARAHVVKEMSQGAPRRIRRLKVRIEMPSGLSPGDRQLMENTANACPVHKSLHPEVEIPVEFVYPD